MHISDLHFFDSDHLKSRKDGLSHYEIKSQILGNIGTIIKNLDIGSVIISGDLELDSAGNLIPFLLEWLSLDCKVFIVFGEHDTRESRAELISKTSGLCSLYIMDEMAFVEDDDLGFNVLGMSCESKQNGFLEKFAELTPQLQTKPSIFLTHPCDLPISKMKQLGFNYYAVGHIHYHRTERIERNIYIGRPGHLYSLWDGNGKAWPVGAIIGEFLGGELELSWHSFANAQTVRLFIDTFTGTDLNVLVIENCTYESGQKVARLVEGEWVDQKFRGIFKGYLNLDIESPYLATLIKEILKIFPNEIFVTPSDSYKMKKKYGYSRGVFRAKTLLSDPELFDEYFERIFKASKKTQ
jgi:DNA repair exonuclease SbcCD nuclease subunit